MCQTKPLHAVKHIPELAGEELAKFLGRYGLLMVLCSNGSPPFCKSMRKLSVPDRDRQIVKK
eukprot:scaffold5326_cov84-Skeletonema_dohrnii-CCMP3373.AAC.1